MVKIALVKLAFGSRLCVPLFADSRTDCVFVQWRKRWRIPTSRMDIAVVRDADDG